MNIPPSYICYSPTGLSLPLPLIYRRAQLRKFIDAPSHITQACALTADFSEGLDLTKGKLEDVLTGFCPKSSVLSTLAPRLIRVSQAACIPAIAARCSGVCFFCKAFILDFIVSYHLLLFYRCKVEQSLLLLQSIFVLDIWGGGRFSVCYHCLLEDIWAKTTNIECFHNKGRFRLPTNWMNFQKNSKWP